MAKNADITFTQGAREIGLAVMLSDLIRQNLEQHSEKIRVFNSLNATIQIEARDLQTTVGLEFRQGKLTVSGGNPDPPDLHIIADSMTILGLCLVRMKFGLPYIFDTAGSKVLKKVVTGELVIKGWVRHFNSLGKLAHLVSVRS